MSNTYSSEFHVRTFTYTSVPENVLADLYGLRKRVFHERLNWEVKVRNEQEFDQYDDHNADYVVVYHRTVPVAGVRLINTQHPYMAQGVFLKYFTQPLPSQEDIIESSRFFVDKKRVKNNNLEQYPLTPILLKAMVEYAQQHGAKLILTIVSKAMARIVKHSGCLYEIYDIGHIRENEPLYLINIEVSEANQASLEQVIRHRWPSLVSPATGSQVHAG